MKFHNKLKIFSCFFLLFCHINSYSQYFKGGISGGISASQMDGDMLGGYHKLGADFGFWVRRDISPLWSYQIEFKYIMKGANSNNATDNYSYYRKTLHYFELPFTVSCKVYRLCSIEAGLSAGYLGFATLNIGDGAQDALSPMKRYDINTLIGINYFLTDRMLVNFRFDYSILPVSKLPGNLNLWGTYGQYNNVLILSLYYQIR
jgi:hypothetical protein